MGKASPRAFKIALTMILVAAASANISTDNGEVQKQQRVKRLKDKRFGVSDPSVFPRLEVPAHLQVDPDSPQTTASPPVIQPKDPYDPTTTFYSGSKTDHTGRFELSMLVVDPLALQQTKENSALGFFSKVWHGLINFIFKFLVSVISLLVLAAYFVGFVFFLWGRRIYDEFWQGMANQYQELPEARVYQVDLPAAMMEFWERFSFKCRRIRTVGGPAGGVIVNTMFKITKIEGQIDPQDYIFDSHMFEVEGLYKMKKRAVIDYKEFNAVKKGFDFDMYDVLNFPDQIDGSTEKSVNQVLSNPSANPRKVSLPQITDPKQRDAIKNYLKLRIATQNPVYYPFIVNLPLMHTPQKVKINGEDKGREWFYFEVEIASRIGFGLNFVIGLLPAPKYDENGSVDGPVEDVDPQKCDKFPTKVEDAVKEGQPTWVTNHLFNLKKSRKIAEQANYIEEWRNIVPGEVADSFGFDISTGKVKVGGGLAYAIDIDEFTKAFYDPTRTLFKTNQPVKSMAEVEQEKAKKFQDEDEEGPQYIGDSFGVAYNCRSGYVFLTYNGTVINKPPDKVNTDINLAIMRKHDDDEEAFDYKKEMEKVNVNPKYLKTLNLDPNTKKEIDIRKFIKINTAHEYVPCIYTDQNTKFRLNFGASAFRNRQPEFQAGILYNLEGDFLKLLEDSPKVNPEFLEFDDKQHKY